MPFPSRTVNPSCAGLVRYKDWEVNTVQAAMETDLSLLWYLSFAANHSIFGTIPTNTTDRK